MVAGGKSGRGKPAVLDLFEKRPLVACVLDVTRGAGAAAAEAEREGADLVELRADKLPEGETAPERVKALLGEIHRGSSLPVILTVRSPEEQGIRPHAPGLGPEKRLAVFETCMPLTDLVDIEIGSGEVARKVAALARAQGKGVIASSHDFKKVPAASRLRTLEKQARLLRADVFKVTGTPRSGREALSFLTTSASSRFPRKCFIAMGPFGRVSRIAGFLFGSSLTYAHQGDPSAPGQIPLPVLVRILKLVYSIS